MLKSVLNVRHIVLFIGQFYIIKQIETKTPHNVEF